MGNNLFFTKVRDVKSPTRGTPGSAGIDFYVPKFTESFITDLVNKNPGYYHRPTINGIVMHPHDRILIPSGICVSIPHGYTLIGHNKSGVASKKGLDILASVIDEDYQSEIHLNVVNTGLTIQDILEDDKLLQYILIPVVISEILTIPTLEELYPVKTDRGVGGFGSTDERDERIV